MKHFRDLTIHKDIIFVIKVYYSVIKHYLSALKKKRKQNEKFIVEVPTTMKNESDKNKLMADVLEILEHEIKLH